MNAHKGITIFTYQQDRLVFDTLDNIDGSLPLVPEFLARSYGKDVFFYHTTTLSELESFANISYLSNRVQCSLTIEYRFSLLGRIHLLLFDGYIISTTTSSTMSH